MTEFFATYGVAFIIPGIAMLGLGVFVLMRWAYRLGARNND